MMDSLNNLNMAPAPSNQPAKPFGKRYWPLTDAYQSKIQKERAKEDITRQTKFNKNTNAYDGGHLGGRPSKLGRPSTKPNAEVPEFVVAES